MGEGSKRRREGEWEADQEGSHGPSTQELARGPGGCITKVAEESEEGGKEVEAQPLGKRGLG